MRYFSTQATNIGQKLEKRAIYNSPFYHSFYFLEKSGYHEEKINPLYQLQAIQTISGE
jgi:hypothetical protein